MDEARAGTLALIAPLSDELLEAQLSPIMSPLVWDLAHIAAYEDLWLAHRHGGLPLLRADLAASTTPSRRPARCAARSSCSAPGAARDYLDAGARAHASTRSTRRASATACSASWSCATSCSTARRCARRMALAGLLPPTSGAAGARRRATAGSRCPAGAFAIGAGPDGLRLRQRASPPRGRPGRRFRSPRARSPTRSWRHFSEGGGYERREWWSARGLGVEGGVRHRSPCRRGDGRSGGSRLPRQLVRGRRLRPRARGAPPDRGRSGSGRRPRGSRPQTAIGSRAGSGPPPASSRYPGFGAYPYREYSEVFFGERYRVLRGGSWATETRVAAPTFRNWDLPQRRQIFAGLRLARDGGS